MCVGGGGGWVIWYLVGKKYYLFLDTSFIPQYLFCFVVLPCGLVCVLWSCLCIVVLSVYCGLVCVFFSFFMSCCCYRDTM